MKDYTKTQLWNRTLAVQPSNDEYKEERDYYRTAYIRFRSKFEVLSREIALSMPQFTVHDITHIDALWDMADIIRYLHARQAEKLCGSTPVWSGLVDTAPALLMPGTASLYLAVEESRKHAPMMKMTNCADMWSPYKTLINLSKTE